MSNYHIFIMLRIQYPLNGKSATRSVAHCARGKRISNKQLVGNANSLLCHVSVIRSYVTLVCVDGGQVFFLFTTLIHLFVRYVLEPKPTRLSERLPGKASYSAGGIVRLTLTERIRFRYVRLRALKGNRFYRFSPDPRNSTKISA